jgi:predicted nucleic acid-binding protein
MSAATHRVFVDTNILVHAHDRKEGPKHETAVATLEKLWRDRTGVLSTQVLEEFYAIAVRKLKPALSPEEARLVVASYGEWCSINTDPQLLVSATFVQERHSVSWREALIIEAALRSGASTLLSEDLQDGRRFGLVTVRNPFAGD